VNKWLAIRRYVVWSKNDHCRYDIVDENEYFITVKHQPIGHLQGVPKWKLDDYPGKPTGPPPNWDGDD